MSQPTEYVRAFNFSNQQAVTPSDPLRADKVDLEYNLIKTSLDETQANLALIQRDDGAVRNATIGYDQLKAELNGFGFNPPSPWLTATNYIARDTVFQGSGFYQALVSHISGVFATDLAAGKWLLVADFTSATTAAAASAAAALASQNAAAGSASAASTSAGTATGAASTATTAASTATTAASTSATNAALTAADVIAAEADKVQTGLDRIQTGADRIATAADRVQTGLDRIAAAASAALINLPSGVPENYLRRKTDNTGYENRDISQVRSDLGGTPFINKSVGLERILVGALIQTSDSSGWTLANDVDHEPAGFNIGTISQTSTYIRVPYEVAGSKVRTLLITPDDAYAMRGLTVGASIGTSYADVYLSLPLYAGVKYDTTNGNEFYGDPAVVNDLSLSHSSGVLTLTHGAQFDQLVQPVVGALRGGWSGSVVSATLPSAGFLEAGGTGASNQFAVQNVQPIHGKLRWTAGTTFAVDADQAGISAAWDGTNKVVVTHPRSQSLYDLSVSSFGYNVLVTDITATSFSVQFISSAGAIQTVPNASFSLMFTRSCGYALTSTFPNRFFAFSRGQVKVNPNKVYGGSGGLLLWGLIKG